MTNYPVLLSGGSGKRLWPLSRSRRPKQFVSLFEEQDKTLFQKTAQRLPADQSFAPPTVICNRDHRFIVVKQLDECGIKPRKIYLEPCGRNTGPAVTAVALSIAKQDPDGIMIVMPSDHIIADQTGFLSAVEKAIDIASTEHFALFGIVPSEPRTGYGYIKRGDVFGNPESGSFQVDRFVEKPDRATAENYLKSGNYYWNSGIFVLPVGPLLHEVKRLQPKMLAACEHSLKGAREDLGFCRLEDHAFAEAPDISLDRAIMEKTEKTVVLPIDVGWSDVGSWTSVSDLIEKDTSGNSIFGTAILQDTSNCLIHSKDRLVAGLGINDLVIVDSSDALIVACKGHAENISTIVDSLRDQGRSEHEQHVRDYRPWGHFESLITGHRFQVKKLHVRPGGVLSLQRHQHRNEHWVVVNGTARITHGDKQFSLNENESTYIPANEWHRIENPGSTPLEIIEVQTGSYLGEDDIERAEDIYGRLDRETD